MKLIKNGVLKVGQKMPTERELAEQLKVSRNTISNAYNELESEGVLRSYQGRGTFVAEEAKPWREEDIREKIIKFVDLGLEEALETGIDTDKFLEIVTQRVKEKKDMMSKLMSVYIECNIEQAKMFSIQLSESTNMSVVPLTIGDLKLMKKDTKNLLQQSQVIIATFNHVNEVIELLNGFNKEVLGVAINADLGTIVKIARYPENTKFAFLCISNEFKFKVHEALENAGLGNINIVFSNTKEKKEIVNIIDNCDVIIVSPGRYKDVMNLNHDNKEIISFLYGLDIGSVKVLKSKIVELKYQK